MGAVTVWKCKDCGACLTTKCIPVNQIRCATCGGDMRAERATSSGIHGAGTNRLADLGLALLLEAQNG